jgi:Protein of unknown function (DUF1266)
MFKKIMSSVKSFTSDDADLEIASSTSLSKSQQWVIAVGALLNAKEGHSLNTLETGTDTSILQGGLANSWRVNDRDEFLALAERLSNLSSQAEYEAVWGEMRKFLGHYSDTSTSAMSKMVSGFTKLFGATNPILLNAAMKTLKGKTNDSDAVLAEKLNNSSQWLHSLEVMGIEAMNVNNLMAWDASRLINISRWAQQIGWITEDEYFSICTPLAERAQKSYGSWKEMLDASFVASMLWNYDEDRLEGFTNAYNSLLKNPQSPVLVLPWDLRLKF